MGFRRDPVVLFMRHVAEDPASDCWVWTGTRSASGYGNFEHAGKNWRAHRYSYERLEGREVPSGKVLDHLCRNRACVNPAHLEPVTGTENIRRGKGAKLTLQRAAEIWALKDSGRSKHCIAREFGVGEGAVRQVWNKRRWPDAEEAARRLGLLLSA